MQVIFGGELAVVRTPSALKNSQSAVLEISAGCSAQSPAYQ